MENMIPRQVVLLRLLCLILWIAHDLLVMAATVTTNALRYEFGTKIILSWNYTSRYTGTERVNHDAVTIVYNNTVPTLENQADVVQMFVFVSSLTSISQSYNKTIRNVGTVTFDGNDPKESFLQAWPLKIGHYRAYVLDSYEGDDGNGTIYAVSDTFTVFSTFLSSNQRSYFLNESITFSWEYTSKFTGTSDLNSDIIGIFNSTDTNVNLLNPIRFVYVSTLRNAVTNTTRNVGSVTLDGRSNWLTWPLPAGSYKAILYDILSSQKYAETAPFIVRRRTVTESPFITTNALRYELGTPIILSWDYLSNYVNTGRPNYDIVAIYYNDTIPAGRDNEGAIQMYVYVSSLAQQINATTRDFGTISFDGNNPVESFAQTWPLKSGYYKAYLFDFTGLTIYAVSDTFTVFPIISSNKRSYFLNEPITVSWDYTSRYTDSSEKNQDFVGIYDSTIANVDLSSPIMLLFVSTFVKNDFNTTLRNIATVTFDSKPPDESGLESWPLQVGSYKAILVDFVGRRKYTESNTFTVGPATLSPTMSPMTITPTKTPSRAPTRAPTKAPSLAPIRKKKQLFCNVFILKNIFCSDRCGFIGRLLKTCKNNEERSGL